VKDVEELISSDAFAKEVREDEAMASQFGISGVPFFVFERKYGVSGAQPVETFAEILGKVGEELRIKD
jgi:predicted DsbA family dithiol-disulfide isomerase